MARIRNPKDFWTGIIYLATGLAAVVIARDYPMGSVLKMGPGYFPIVLGALLALIGFVSLIRSFIVPGEPIGAIAVKGLLFVIGGTLIGAALIRSAGAAIALPVLVLISAYASVRFRWAPMVALAAGLTIFCVVVFLYGLGIPLPILGSWFNG